MQKIPMTSFVTRKEFEAIEFSTLSFTVYLRIDTETLKHHHLLI